MLPLDRRPHTLSGRSSSLRNPVNAPHPACDLRASSNGHCKRTIIVEHSAGAVYKGRGGEQGRALYWEGQEEVQRGQRSWGTMERTGGEPVGRKRGEEGEEEQLAWGPRWLRQGKNGETGERLGKRERLEAGELASWVDELAGGGGADHLAEARAKGGVARWCSSCNGGLLSSFVAGELPSFYCFTHCSPALRTSLPGRSCERLEPTKN